MKSGADQDLQHDTCRVLSCSRVTNQYAYAHTCMMDSLSYGDRLLSVLTRCLYSRVPRSYLSRCVRQFSLSAVGAFMQRASSLMA